jgi:predicted lipoprotein with Yx(FWY)xxD motif
MKNAWIWIVVIVAVVGIGYFAVTRMGSSYSGAGGATPIPGYASSAPVASPVTSGDVITTQSGAKGNYLTGASGLSLYVFDNDTTGVSNCSGSCLDLWHPYTTLSVPATLPAGIATITRSDGSIQFTYKGRPLYNYSGDSQAGDINGDGINGTWHLAKP